MRGKWYGSTTLTTLPLKLSRLPSRSFVDSTGRVGFDTLGDQQLRKSLKRGFDFNILVLGSVTREAL